MDHNRKSCNNGNDKKVIFQEEVEGSGSKVEGS